MADYIALQKRLFKEIAKQDGKIEQEAGVFVRELLVQLQAEGWTMGDHAEAELTAYLEQTNATVKAGITAALTVTSKQTVFANQAVLKMADDAFTEQWPDGVTLSERLWKFDRKTRQGITEVLQQGIRQGKANGALVMQMQRLIERNHGGERFTIIQHQKDDWVKKLHKAGQDLIHDPNAKAAWLTAVDEVEDHIIQLSKTGTRSAAEQVLKQISEAVEKGREELLDKAVKWWVYDKQLYGLKRIARTEMATAAHRAVIASTVDDERIIGYQWRLSGSHPDPDICDYYATIEMGLGKGVWTKEAVPRHKAHPHCMCLLIPRVTPVKQKGKGSYQDFIEKSTDAEQKKLLPQWAQRLRAHGVPTGDLVRADGLWSMSKKAMVNKLGKQRFDALIKSEDGTR